MQDASLQESMGPIVDRTKENLVSTDNGIIMARHRLLRAAKALMDKGMMPPGRRSGASARALGRVVLPPDKPFKDAAKEALIVQPGVAQRRSELMLSESARATTAAEARFRIDAPNSQPRAVKVIALDAPSEAVVKRLARAAAGAARASSPRRRSAAAPARQRNRSPCSGWLSDLAGRTKNLLDEVAAPT